MDAESVETVDSLLNPALAPDERVRSMIPLIYDQLRGAAHQALMEERADHTLEATALVHEAYLRLVGQREVPWQNRAHFYAAAAEAMRRALLDHAKGRGRLGTEVGNGLASLAVWP
jgi:hypothetical protein